MDENGAQEVLELDITSQSNDTIDDERYPEMDYFLNEEESDVVFIIDGQRVPAKREVLRLKSKVFRAMFSGNFKESTDKEVPIEDTTVDAFKTMLQYLYTEQLVLKDNKDVELISDVLAIADRYRVLRLITACDQHMKTIDVTIDNTTVMYGLAEKYGLNESIKTLKTFIVTNLDTFLAKKADDLVALNVATNEWLVEIMAKRLSNTRNFLRQLTYVENESLNHYYYKQEFPFDDPSIN